MLTINISELLLTVLSFFVLMFLLNKLLFKPVIAFREQRQGRIDACYEQERLAKEQQSQAQELARQRRSEAMRQAESISAEAKQQAELASQEAARQSQQLNAQLMEQAEGDAQRLHEEGTRLLSERRVQLAQVLADRLSQ